MKVIDVVFSLIGKIAGLLILLMFLVFGYNAWLSHYELNAYPVQTQDFHFIIARGGDEAKQCIDVGSIVPQNYINVASWAGRVDGHIYFKLLCNFSDEYPAFSIQLLNLSSYSDKTGIFGRTLISKKIDYGGNNLRVFLNSSAMEINETYHFEFELWYNKTFSNRYYVTFQDAIINLAGFSYSKDYICQTECFTVYDQKVTPRSIVPIPFPKEKILLLSKSFEVSGTHLTFWFSPKSRKLELWSKIIDGIVFGLAASFIYGLIIVVASIFKGSESKQFVLLKQEIEQKTQKRRRPSKKKAAPRKRQRSRKKKVLP